MRPDFFKQRHRRKFFLGLSLLFVCWLAWFYQYRSQVRLEQQQILNTLQQAGYKLNQLPPDSFVSDILHSTGSMLSRITGEAAPFVIVVSLEAPTSLTTEQFSEHAQLTNLLEFEVALTFKNCHQLTNLNGLSDSPNLTSLGIESCPQITDLSGLEDNRTLRVLMVSECPQFTHLNALKEVNTLQFVFLDQLEGLTDISFAYDLHNLRNLEINKCHNFGSRSWGPETGKSVENYLLDD